MVDRTHPDGDGVPPEDRGPAGEQAAAAHDAAAPAAARPADTVAPVPAGDTSEPRRARPRSTRRGSTRRGSTREQKPDTLWGSVREVVVVLVWAVLIAFVVKSVLVRGFYIPSGSMEETLQLDDRIFVNVLEPTFGPLERGDIVVFEDSKGWLPERPEDGATGPMAAVHDALSFVGVLPDRTDQHLIKRVIGVGGDRVVCCDAQGRLTVNGEPLEERDAYLHPGSAPSEIPFDIVVPEGHYFVMGDHRDASADSRVHFGDLVENSAFISHDDVVGTAFVIAWPLDRFEWLQNPEEVFEDVPDEPAGGA